MLIWSIEYTQLWWRMKMFGRCFYQNTLNCILWKKKIVLVFMLYWICIMKSFYMMFSKMKWYKNSSQISIKPSLQILVFWEFYFNGYGAYLDNLPQIISSASLKVHSDFLEFVPWNTWIVVFRKQKAKNHRQCIKSKRKIWIERSGCSLSYV